MTIGARASSSSAGLPRGLAVAAAFVVAAGPGLAFLLAGLRAGVLAGLGVAVLMVLVVGFLSRHYPHDRLGQCNQVTLLRAAMVVALAGLLGVGLHGLAVFCVAAVALALDGVDGWLARREGLTSAFGARFDMETDAALALILAGHVWMAGMTGPEILVLGLMRYVFVLGFLPFPWLSAPLPDRFGRKVVCVVQVAALILLQVPGLPQGMVALIAWPAVAALVWSFGRDTLWLWRNRA